MADDDARRRVADEGHLADAMALLTTDAFSALPFEAMAPTKALLKRYFSAQPWGAQEDAALADAVGPGAGRWRRPLGDDLALDYGWDDDGRFGVAVTAAADGAATGDTTTADTDTDTATATDAAATAAAGEAPPVARPDAALAATFDGPVVPEATPSARTIRFATPPLHDGPSRWYPAADDVDDPRAARLFAEFDEVANVLVGNDFVAVGLRRPDAWERLLVPVLAAVTEAFTEEGAPAAEPVGATPPPWVVAARAGQSGQATPSPRPGDGGGRRAGALDRAWADLGRLHGERPDELARLLDAAGDADPARRQVAAALLADAPDEVADTTWWQLAADERRAVRRAAVDAAADAGRASLRPLLERAVGDEDGWTRWRALRGLAELGPAASRDVVRAATGDRDLRVRLEAVAALRDAG